MSVSPLPAPAPPQQKVPKQTVLWLILGVLSLLLVNLQGRQISGDRVTRKQETGPSATEFRDAISGETETHLALVALVFQEEARRLATDHKEKTNSSSTRQALREALAVYRKLLPLPASPNVARRLLILEHLAGSPLNEDLLKGELSGDLRDLKTGEAEIAAEVALWRSLYGVDGPPPATGSDQRIRKMHLRLLGTQALIDLYERQQNPSAAAQQRLIRNQATFRFFLLNSVQNIAIVLAFLTGVFLLVRTLFLSLKARRLTIPGAVRAEMSPDNAVRDSGFYDLIDGFAFYFATFEFFRLVLGLLDRALPARGGGGSSGGMSLLIALDLLVYLIPHAVAFAYIAYRFRKTNREWKEIGVTFRQLWGNIGYGILGYCAALPLILLMSWCSEKIFHNNPNVTPNPALSLITASNDISGRILLFLMVAVAAPLCEEFFFRGVLLTGLRKRYAPVVTILISGLIFALGHPIQDWLPILGLGVVFGALRDARQSLIPSITAHFLQNGLTFLSLSLLFGGN